MEAKMASIYGFTLKNRKTFQGLDWQGNQDDLHYKSKKVAWYNDSGNGGSCDIVYYDNSAPILEETIKRTIRAGHARTSTATDIYSHLLKTADRSAAQKLEEIFD